MFELPTILLAAAVLCMALAAARVKSPIDLVSAGWAFALGWLLAGQL